jgi:hypothetical protein
LYLWLALSSNLTQDGDYFTPPSGLHS